MNRSIRSSLFALFTCTTLAGCDGGAETDPDRPPAGGDPKAAPIVTATRVEAAVVKPSQTALRLVRPGEVEPSRDADVASALGGFIEHVAVDVGDEVKAGGLIAKIDTKMQVAQRELADVEVAEARRELSRLQNLGSAVAKSRTDAAQTRLERALAQQRISQIRATRSIVRAPFAGVISRISADRGEVAAPGAPIARIIQLDPAIVSVSISDRDVAGLAVDDEAFVTTGGQAKRLRGKIQRIEPTADMKTRSFRVEVAIESGAAALRPGMIANVEFRGDDTTERMVIPQDLLVTKLEANGVFLVGKDSKAVWRALTLGSLVGEQIVVESGLSAGDRVVSTGQRALSDGDPLLVTREGRCCVGGRIVFGDPRSVAQNDKKGPPSSDTKPAAKADAKEPTP
ncbi:MAG: efflux RND transporter periplasmic adaptor subunit [Myxococcales bacterium FL481]|nr:MAG: efflux RND transporter periplasmic adaptor subunit [Myxococcales bacterium FL481]